MMGVDWTYEDGDKGWLLEVSVDATVVPRMPARTNCRNDDSVPAEGGYLEDEKFTVTGFELEIGKYVHDIPVVTGSELQAALNEVVLRAYNKDRDLQEEVFLLFTD